MVVKIRYIVLVMVVTLLVSGVAYAYPWSLMSRYYAIQPTTPSISSNNAQGYLIQLPQCYISSNPYGGATGTYGMLNCVAINYGAISIVIWFYEPPGGQGGLVGVTTKQYPSPVATIPLIFVDNGYLYALGLGGLSISISPGWHMVVLETWASSSSGPFYFSLYLDGNFVASSSFSSSAFYNYSSTFPYSDVGATYNYFPSEAQWFFFNGIIAYVAIYNTVLNSSQVQQLYSVGFPNMLFSNNLVVAYLLVNNTASIYQGPNYVDYIIPWFVNKALLSRLNITNPSTFVIAPTGLPGLVPSGQFLGPIPNNLFSWCRLLQNISVSVPSHVYVNQSFIASVTLTTNAQMQYELPYWFLVSINGTNESQVLRVDAWLFSGDAVNAHTFINSTTLVAPPKPGNYTVVVSLPVCNTTWTKQITVNPPPSNASTTGSNGNNSTSPPPTNSTNSTQSGPGTSSSSSTSSTTTSTSSTTDSSVLIDALNTVVQYLVNPVVVVVVVVVLIVIGTYILYRHRETVVRL
jgi:hypothetical protein